MSKATIDRDEIQKWVEGRGGYPAHVKRTGGGSDLGILRIDYPGYSGQGSLERITWDQFFDAFDANNLAFVYQETGNSRFSRLVDRSKVELTGGGRSILARAASALLGRSGGGSSASSQESASSKRSSARKGSKKRTTSKKASSKKSSSKKSSSKKSSKKSSSKKKSARKR